MSGGAKGILERFEALEDVDYGDGPNERDDDFDEEEGNEGVGDDDETTGDDEGGEEDLSDEELVSPTPPQKGKKKAKEAEEEQPPAQSRAEFRRLANGTHIDAKGNIVDPRDGTVIARNGSERRLFEKNVRMTAQLETANAEITRLKSGTEQTQYLNGVPQRFNLQPDDVQTALALAAVYKKDPVEAARNMIEMVLALGHNVTDILGNEAGNAVEMKAISQMLDDRLAPITKAKQDEDKQTQSRQAAERQLAQFIDDHEHSDLHLNVIDRMMGDNPDLTPEKAYYELKLFCQRRGLDFAAPLQPQMQALKQRAQPNGGVRQRPAESRGSLPNGRQSAGAQRSVAETVQADPSMSWSDIIKSSMS